MPIKNRRLRIALLSGLGALAGCSDLFEVTNPGPIPDDLLNSPEAVPSMVVGMSADLSIVLDDVIRMTSIAGDELYHGGSYTQEGLWNRGILRPEDVNYEWAAMHRARVEAEQGIERMKAITGYSYEGNKLSIRANLLAGFANRLLGETVCNAVINGGAAQSHMVHFQRAEAYFTEALRLAALPAIADVNFARAAYGGRAAVRAAQGKWAEAVSDAAQVPTSFVHSATYSTNSDRENNSLVYETWVRREFTVFNTQWAQVFNDPRVPWDTVKTSSGAIQKGQDGRTNYFRQAKFNDLGSDVPLVRGTEMLMLRAEHELRQGNIDAAFTLINQQRAFYSTTAKPLAALTPPADLATAWQVLHKEKGAVVWIEGRRFWDLRRWNAETGPAHHTWFDADPTTGAQRNNCIPISQDELDSNPNV